MENGLQEVVQIGQQTAVAMVSFLFILSGIGKLVSPGEFRNSLTYLPYFPLWLVPIVTFFLPPLELVLALALFFGSYPARLALVGLLLIFCSAALVVIWKAVAVRCSCFGAHSNEKLSWGTVRRNLLLVVVLLSVPPTSYPTSPWLTGSCSASLLFITLAGGTIYRTWRDSAEVRVRS